MNPLVRLGLCALSALPIAARADSPSPWPPALDATSFDRLTRGKTFDTHDAELGLYGVESFFEGRRVRWRDAEKCVEGFWYQAGAQICFIYDNRQDSPVCWRYHEAKGAITGYLAGDPEDVPIWLYHREQPAVVCEGFVGA